MAVPSPADAPTMSAAELIAHIREEGGRVFRFCAPSTRVFALTTDRELSQWLVKRGGKPFVPVGMGVDVDGGYMRAAGGKREWDIAIQTMPVTDVVEVGHPVWSAAA